MLTTNTFWQTVAETPWWLYAIIIALFGFGIRTIKPRIVSASNFLAPALLLFIFSIVAMAFLITNQPIDLPLLWWSAAFCLGIALGWLQTMLSRLRAIKGSNQLYLPGSFQLLIILGITCPLYYNDTIRHGALILATSTALTPIFTLLLGLSPGIAIGRATCALYCLKVGPYIDKTGGIRVNTDKRL